MNTNDNMLSDEQPQLINKGFSILNAHFTNYGWHLVKNQNNWINYTKFGDETSFFDIKITNDKIIVCVPIKNSPFQYTKSYNNYFEASEFIEQKLDEYMA